ncbi:hypothetical protein Ri1_13410 [Aeromonas dhakensis]|nr:hypothetical protein Ri1_13410 [Aeromonas dhakensis]
MNPPVPDIKYWAIFHIAKPPQNDSNDLIPELILRLTLLRSFLLKHKKITAYDKMLTKRYVIAIGNKPYLDEITTIIPRKTLEVRLTKANMSFLSIPVK